MTIDDSIRLHDVISAACEISGLRRIELTGSGRTARVVYWRHLAMHVAHTLTHASLTNIATAFGRDDHTTALWAIRKIACARIFAAEPASHDAERLERAARAVAAQRVEAARAVVARRQASPEAWA